MSDTSALAIFSKVIAYPDPPLRTEAVALRRWALADLPLVQRASADHELLAGTTLPAPFTPEAGVAFIERQWGRAESGEGLSLAIADGQSGNAVGCATLMLRREQVADLGYWLLGEVRGRGIAGATVALLVPWALQALEIEAVEAFVHPDNEASRRTLTRCDFTAVGSARHTVGRIDEELLVYRRTE